MPVKKRGIDGDSLDADEGVEDEYIVEYLQWTEEQKREWILALARFCVDLYNRQDQPNKT